MRLILTLIVLLAFGCSQDHPHRQATTSRLHDAAKIETKSTPAAKSKQTAAGQRKTEADPIRAMRKQAALDRARSRLRQAKYLRQNTIKTPNVLSSSVIRLLPKDLEYKVTGFEVHLGMKQVKPAPNHRFDRLRWVTLIRGASLRAQILEALRSRGWLQADQAFTPTIQHPKFGRLRIQIKEPPEAPTEVMFSLESSQKTMNTQPWSLLGEEPVWLSVAQTIPMLGFEYSRFHGVHFGSSFTDIERIAVAFQPKDQERFQNETYNVAKAKGYTPRLNGSKALRGPKGKQSLLITQHSGTVSVLHAQRRWGDSKTAFKTRNRKK